MNYLKYIEHDAENLQFFLWARAYRDKFEKLPPSEKRLAPEWTDSEAEIDAAQAPPRVNKVSADTAAMLKGTGLESTPRITESSHNDHEKSDPFHTPPRTPSNGKKQDRTPSEASSTEEWSISQTSTENTAAQIKRKAEGAFDDAGLKWQPCKSCPAIEIPWILMSSVSYHSTVSR